LPEAKINYYKPTSRAPFSLLEIILFSVFRMNATVLTHTSYVTATYQTQN